MSSDRTTPESTMSTAAPGLTPMALQGVKIVEMGQLIAGPFAGKTLGEFGAEVIKIESPGRVIRCATGG